MANTTTPYKVYRYKQDSQGDYPSPTSPSEVESLTGTTDTTATATSRTYTGYTFHSSAAQSVAILMEMVV